MRLEQVRSNAIFQRLAAGEIIELYTRIEYRNSNDRLINLIENYDERNADEFLSACAHYVGE